MKAKYKHLTTLILIVALLFTTGCGSDDVADGDSTSIISPNISTNEHYYRGVLPYHKSPINGTLKALPNRLDVGHFELTLLEYAQRHYNPANYIFTEGQILTNEHIRPYVYAQSDSSYESFVYSIIEHDYHAPNGNLEGLVVGITVSPTYYAKEENGEYKRNVYGERISERYTDAGLIEKSKALVEELTNLIRRETFVPIEFAVMRAEDSDVKIPGAFVLTGSVQIGERSVAKYEKINERFVFLPISGTKQTEVETEMSRGFIQLKRDVSDFLPRFAGVTGIVRLVDEKPVELKLEMFTEFDSTPEVIQLTQLSIDRISTYFPRNMSVYLYVSTVNKPKALYIRSASGEDFMHIYRN